MKGHESSNTSIAKRAANEFKEYIVIAAYLLICFTAILYLKSTILRAHGIAFEPFGLAAVKALICAKFVSLGHIVHVGERFNSRPLILVTLYRSFAFLVLLIALNALEEVITGFIHHRSLTESLSEFGGGSLDQLIATSVVGLLILIPFFAFRTLGEVIGERNLLRLFFTSRREIEKVQLLFPNDP